MGWLIDIWNKDFYHWQNGQSENVRSEAVNLFNIVLQLGASGWLLLSVRRQVLVYFVQLSFYLVLEGHNRSLPCSTCQIHFGALSCPKPTLISSLSLIPSHRHRQSTPVTNKPIGTGSRPSSHHRLCELHAQTRTQTRKQFIGID